MKRTVAGNIIFHTICDVIGRIIIHVMHGHFISMSFWGAAQGTRGTAQGIRGPAHGPRGTTQGISGFIW